MVADAHSLQFKLPPPGVPLPASRINPAVAAGAPLVEALTVTSVWCVQLLKTLCQVRGARPGRVDIGAVRGGCGGGTRGGIGVARAAAQACVQVRARARVPKWRTHTSACVRVCALGAEACAGSC